MYKCSCLSVPYFARSVIASSDKLISILVERTVGEREHMTFKSTKELELLLFLFINLCDQLDDHRADLRTPCFSYQRLLLYNFVDELIDVSV